MHHTEEVAPVVVRDVFGGMRDERLADLIKTSGRQSGLDTIEKARCALPFAPGLLKMAEWFSPTTKFVKLNFQ